MENEILCEDCGKEFPEDEIEQCACGIPFCVVCYDVHVRICDEAVEAMDASGFPDEA